MAYTVDDLLGTSASDMKSTIEHIEDVNLLRAAHQAAVERGLLTKSLHLERRLKRLRKVA